jgi:hypothetical protein
MSSQWIDCPLCEYGVKVGNHCENCNEFAGNGQSQPIEDSPNDSPPCRCEDYPCCGC